MYIIMENSNTKWCTKCQQYKLLDEFGKNKSRPDGLQFNCKACSALITKHSYKNNEKFRNLIYKRNAERLKVNQELVDDYLLTHPCIDCGITNPIVLEFDHVSGEKKFTISKGIRNRKTKALIEEIEKCEVRCVNCHRRKTSKQFGFYKSIDTD